MNRGARPPCTVGGCGAPASHVFEAVTGEQVEKIVDERGRRVRACRGHFQLAVDHLSAAMQALPGGGPARLRPVPLVAG